jgi:hypothetical protein
MKKLSLGLAVLLTLGLNSAAFGDYLIKLKNGRTVETSKYWEEKNEVKFQWQGGVASFPRGNILSITRVEGKSPDRAVGQNQAPAEPRGNPAEVPPLAAKKEETPNQGQSNNEINVENYRKQKAYYTQQYEEAYQKYLDATSRRDPEAKKKAWDEFNKYGGEVVKMETELRKKNNGEIPSWWREKASPHQ